MNVAEFDYDLPPQFIAQTPLAQRDASRLMRLDRRSGAISHHIFTDIEDMLAPNDVLVVNDTRVIPARLRAGKAETGGAVEILLLKQIDERTWHTLVGGRNVRLGMRLVFAGSNLSCSIVDVLDGAERVLEFSRPIDRKTLAELGDMPLPPYIRSELANGERYQTVYSKTSGSAAAPTAGLHFTPDLLERLRLKGVKRAACTLHIGLDTFQPVTVERVQDHKIHSEFARLDEGNATIIYEAKRAGGRIIAVGTTSARTLETAGMLCRDGDPNAPSPSHDPSACPSVIAFETNTDLFITPGYEWRVVDAIITNFHLPKSTLLMMISAFAGRERLLNAYELAKASGYRFYSFGDAMFIC
ncbi:MAG: tRNA preQ1(34) S-adenosylmethionine ribosyltransferase-isomerase QueA [Chloroflexi bacterium]|nr:tRNA preQ1(34) S-adenosylmethionine ribosyltransferase-isomerase QueA [Chloroflexota bacterium]